APRPTGRSDQRHPSMRPAVGALGPRTARGTARRWCVDPLQPRSPTQVGVLGPVDGPAETRKAPAEYPERTAARPAASETGLRETIGYPTGPGASDRGPGRATPRNPTSP